MNSFREWFEHVSHGKQIVACGDFNVDLLSNTIHSRRLKNICDDNGMTQLVDKPTRVEKDTSTLIDLCVTNINKRNISCKVLDDDQISDHAIIETIIQGKAEAIQLKNRKITVWCDYDKNILWQSLENEVQQWNDVIHKSVNEKMDWLLNSLSNSTEQFKKTKEIRSKNDFFDRNLEAMRVHKNKLYKMARYANESESNEKWHEYRVYKNSYKTAIQDKKDNLNQTKLNMNQR